MTFDKHTAMQRSKERAFKMHNYKRAVTSALRDMGIEEEFDTFCYLAIATTLVNGGVWDDDEIQTVLDAHDDTYPQSLITCTLALKEAGVLQAAKSDGIWRSELSLPFKKKAEEFIAEHINQLPAQMLPLENVPKWETAHKNELNISLISRVPKAVLQRQPQKVLDAVNKLQDVKFRVNPALVAVLKYRLAEVTRENQEATFDKWRTEITVLKNQIAHLTELSKTQTNVQFLVTMDFRGRCYYRGGILTPQGHDFQKAAFQFAKARKLGKMGKGALAIHFANVADMDKVSTQDKIKWAMTSGTELASEISQGLIPKEMKKKYQVIVAAMEWHRLMQWEKEGNKTSKFKSRLVCHMDGTCNGLQHGAALRGDRKTAIATNCVASTFSQAPQDIYQEGVDILASELRIRHPQACALIEAKGRNAMKQPVMITGYGAGLNRATAACLDQFTPDQQKILVAAELEQCMEVALDHVAGALIHTHKILSKAVEAKMNKGVQPIGWMTEDGFLVFQAARASDVEGKEYKGAGDYMYRVDEINRDKQRTSITANFIHSMDAAHMRAVARTFDYELVTVHDSYGCHAGTFFELAQVTREQFVKVHQHDQLGSLNKLNEMKVTLSKMGDYDASEVMESEYFFS